jgi:hypothetical protein
MIPQRCPDEHPTEPRNQRRAARPRCECPARVGRPSVDPETSVRSPPECPSQIGIGGSLAAPPLPHHRAYGSVHGGSTAYAPGIQGPNMERLGPPWVVQSLPRSSSGLHPGLRGKTNSLLGLRPRSTYRVPNSVGPRSIVPGSADRLPRLSGSGCLTGLADGTASYALCRLLRGDRAPRPRDILSPVAGTPRRSPEVKFDRLRRAPAGSPGAAS